MHDNKISIIIPNYNGASYLDDCLISVLNQTYRPIEIIIVDDCSKDNSVKIIKKYYKKYPDIIKYLINRTNLGVAQTRHIGIDFASGKFISTLDSDDYYYNNYKLQNEFELIKTLKKKYGKEIIPFSKTILVSDKDKTVISKNNKNNIKEGNLLYDILCRTCEIPRDFILLKKSYYNIGGYDFGLPIYEDWDLKIRLASKYDFYYTGASGTAYRQHCHGLSSCAIAAIKYNLNRVFHKNISLLPRHQLNSARFRLFYINSKLYIKEYLKFIN